MSAPEFDPRTIDNFLNDLNAGLKAKEAKDKAEKQDKKYDKATEKGKAFVTNVASLIKLCSPFSKDLKPEERQKLLDEALTGLLGAVIGDGGDELAEEVHQLVDLARGTVSDDEKRKAIEKAITKLAKKVGKALSDKETGGQIGELTESVLTLIKLAQGGLTEKERDDLLSDAGWKLITSDLIKRQLEWFVSESFLTYAQAVKIGYDLGKPFGDYVKKTLEPVGKAKHWQDTFIALQQKNGSWIESVATSREPVQVSAQGGSVAGAQITAYWDVLMNDIRIQVVTPSGHVTLLDKDGLDMTGEDAGQSVSDGGAQQPEGYHEGDITMAAQSNVERAKQIADNDPKVKELKASMDELHATAVATETRAADAQRAGDVASYQDLETKYRLQYSQYWIAREKWKKAIHDWFVKAASAEAWGTLEKSYMWRQYRIFAFEDWEVRAVMPGAGSAGGVLKMPRAVSRAGIYALIGTIMLLILGGFGFAALRGNPASVASDAAANSTASSRASGAATSTQAQGSIICPPAPDISITLSGAASGTVTKSCEPWVSLAQRDARPNTPYCRLEGIPNKPNVVAGVYSSQVMFMLSGTKYQLVIQYVADVRSKATNGVLPVTLSATSGDGSLRASSWPATDEIPGRGTVIWNPASGTYTIGADGTTGTIDADFTSPDGRTLHLKGSWTVAKGCPPVG